MPILRGEAETVVKPKKTTVASSSTSRATSSNSSGGVQYRASSVANQAPLRGQPLQNTNRGTTVYGNNVPDDSPGKRYGQPTTAGLRGGASNIPGQVGAYITDYQKDWYANRGMPMPSGQGPMELPGQQSTNQGTLQTSVAAKGRTANEIQRQQQMQVIGGQPQSVAGVAPTGGSGTPGGPGFAYTPPGADPNALGTTSQPVSGTGPTPTEPGANQPATDEDPYRTISAIMNLRNQGITPNEVELMAYRNALLSITGLNEPLQAYGSRDPVQLQVGQTALDANGIMRGVRADIIEAVLGKNIQDPQTLTEVAGQLGHEGLTVDEIQIMFPDAANAQQNTSPAGGELGFNWLNQPNQVAPDGSSGVADSAGGSIAPIFSGFYRGGDGRYYPINAAALAPKRWSYSSDRGGGGSNRPPTPTVIDNGTQNDVNSNGPATLVTTVT